MVLYFAARSCYVADCSLSFGWSHLKITSYIPLRQHVNWTSSERLRHFPLITGFIFYIPWCPEATLPAKTPGAFECFYIRKITSMQECFLLVSYLSFAWELIKYLTVAIVFFFVFFFALLARANILIGKNFDKQLL